jgi:NADPH-dependent 2,4-dienoyl-CoA reductase/sulfur reductase-like enzyme
MLDAGIEVVAVVEATRLSDSWRYLPDLCRQPKLMLQGLKYMYRLRHAGVPLLQRSVLKEIKGDTQVESVVVEKVDSRGNTVPGQIKTFAADTVSMGYGLIPRIRISQMLGCKHIYNPLIGGWIPHFDENMQTSRPGIFVAGDGAGVAGAMTAKKQGALAGLFTAVGSGIVSNPQAEQSVASIRNQLTSIGRFRRAMDRIYPVNPALYSHVTDDTIVCRCEGVTAGAIRKVIHDGTPDLNDIKKRTRAGMGYCQGANCMPVIAAILTHEFNVRPEEISMMTNRPPAGPLPLHLLMVDPESA